MLQIATSRLFFSGFLATFVISLMLLPVFSASDRFAEYCIFFLCGTFVFPLLYAMTVGRYIRGNHLLTGMGWGVVIWFVVQAAVLPIAGYGFFGSGLENANVLLPLTLFIHIIYGLLFGGFIPRMGFILPRKVAH